MAAGTRTASSLAGVHSSRERTEFVVPSQRRDTMSEESPFDGPLGEFWQRAILCRVCPGIAPHRKFPLASHGTARYRCMLVGEAPGRVSLDNGRAFSNPRNLVVRRAFSRAVAPAKLQLEEVFYVTDVVKCWPATLSGANRSPRASEVRTCVERHLRIEIELLAPGLIVAFGALAVQAVLGAPVRLAEIHGKPQITGGGARLLPLMHPSSANLAGLRAVGICSLAEYEEQLRILLGRELLAVLRAQ